MHTCIPGTSVIVLVVLVALQLTRTAAENLPYTVTGTMGEIEFRHYPPLVLATADNDMNDAGFNLLFAYISGSNKARDTIPMTAPVLTSQKIPMTAPVVSDPGTISFVMPVGKSREEIPDPTDSRVRIVTIPEREIAVLRFPGYAQREETDAVTVRLEDGLNNAGITPAGPPFLMRYDPPGVPGFLRRNEVGIEIRR